MEGGRHHSPSYHIISLFVTPQLVLVDALQMAPKVIQTWPWFLLGFAARYTTAEFLSGSRLWNGRRMFAFGMPFQVISCTESFFAGASRHFAHEWFRVSQVMFPTQS